MNWIPLMVPTEDYAELSGIVLQRTLDRQRTAAEHAPVDVTHSQAAPLGDYRFPMQPNESAAAFRALLPTPTWNERARWVAQAALLDHAAWNVGALERFADSQFLTVQRWHTAMDLCAQHPNTFFATSDVVERTSLQLNEWRDAPRKISAHLAKHYPEVMGTWPLVAVGGRELGTYDEVYWAMTGDVAVTWSQIRGLEMPDLAS